MKVGIIGAGTMGSGIAQAFAMTDGYEVCLCDIKTEFAESGKAKIQKNLNFLVGKGKMEQAKADAIIAKVQTGLKEICTDCDLVIEVCPEKMEIKKQTFAELQNIVKKDCIFASNTSSLSITEMGAGLDRPLIGMHFFNPADRMKLVEVIAGANTPAELVTKIKDISKEIGKTPVEVNEAAGFVVNRILVPMINEAINVYAAGVASVEDIDVAMQLGANHPMGPLALGDYIGLDIVLAIMEVLYAETGDSKYAPSPLLRKMVRAGKLGKKTGIGFYDYSK
ncbi:MAG: 3-hydroxyacyl-CoA dehydrogenase NAD-binding domain-containing protein [Lachnospiraceae bacterium]|nr:3-hydroxyacyl-CoA dehydrogenase NAD-binding domain-containing protein [Lachnospiraceae bacterium]MDD7148780.1 3-hydroxyacyl-CoA dehydrogenase NAD-binding domain-containing protein [Lachnospiraceae bacterium]MDY4068864.1 3-hydroxyacyl-CoA dehydrogenase NAD-binding domain-containing protein [Lachnospiraceae bacterium]